jgi:hypothetical protein
MRRLHPASLLTVVLAISGCNSSYGDGSGVSEPIVVSGSSTTFIKGAMPNDDGPELLLASSVSSSGYAGGPDKSVSGRTTLAAYGVAMRLKGQGTGYWVAPVGLPDLMDPGLGWSLKFRFTDQAPLGDQSLLIAQTDVHGKFGKPSVIPFKVKSFVPDGTKVISLIWQNRADLDLQIQGPSGKLTSAKYPNTGTVPDDHQIPEGGLEGSGKLDHDSNAHCAFDGLMREDVVFTGEPTPGDYLVWVDLWDSCGESATTFELLGYDNGDVTYQTAGQVLDVNADNGTGAGLFLHTFSF